MRFANVMLQEIVSLLETKERKENYSRQLWRG
jgi:hypothetical protein